jgi:isoquinoline 1-oxidoreductase subunit alpha
MTISITVNDQTRTVDVEADTPLLWVLRDELRLTGTKFGCGMAQCGACTVQVDGRPTRACVTPVSAVAGARVVTIEGLAGPVAEAVRDAWRELDTPQCGYCQSGQIVAAEALLRSNAKPTDTDIDTALAGNLCRCATYARIRKAIHRAAGRLGSEER